MSMSNDELLEKLVDKTNEHDMSLTLIAKAVEDMNTLMQSLVENSRALEKTMAKHWTAQESNAIRMENILGKVVDQSTRISVVEQKQHTGCPALINLKEIRAIEIKAFKKIADDVVADVETLRTEVEAIKSIPNKILWKFGGIVTTAAVGIEVARVLIP